MNDDPIQAAIDAIPHNSLLLEGGASKSDGAVAKGTFERDKGSISIGVTGEVSQKKGGSIFGFFKKVWK